MKAAIATLRSASHYSQSRNIDAIEHPKKPKETPDAYEARMWRNRMHVDDAGKVMIPRNAFSHAVTESARRLQIPIPGKRMAFYTKHFEAGFQVLDDLHLDLDAADVHGERLFVPSDGRPGGGKRVYRTFPKIPSWSGTVRFAIFDDVLSEDVFRNVLQQAGILVGIGRFRPEKRGFYGRFVVERFEWDDEFMGVQAAE